MKRMFYQIVVLALLICMGCHSGILPCPKVKTAKVKKSNPHRPFAVSSSTMTADAEEKTTSRSRSRGSDLKTVQNVSVEEWDCPHPGKRKYMPRRVKENIRKNMEKVNSTKKDAVEIPAPQNQ